MTAVHICSYLKKYADMAGVVLLLKPNFDPDQMAMYFNYLVGNYWPAILIIIGLLLVNPNKKKTRGKSR